MVLSPPPHRIEEVSDELKCSICFGVPLKPKLTPCEHVFCNECIYKALDNRSRNDDDDDDEDAHPPPPSCPNCRTPCTRGQLKNMTKGSFMYRVWSSVIVKCTRHDQGCSWTGSIEDFQNHYDSKHKKKNVEADEDISKNTELFCLQEENKKLKIESENLIEIVATFYRKYELLSEDPRLELPVLFDSEGDNSRYSEFNRNNVVELSQLVSRFLEDKPDYIDRDRIYACVRKCQIALEKDYTDNPEHLHVDMRMLLATCYASTWFTDRQSQNIYGWLTNM